MATESLRAKAHRLVMTATIKQLSDPEYLSNNILIGEPTSAQDENVCRALEFRKLLEDLKATRASHWVSVIAVIIATVSIVISALT